MEPSVSQSLDHVTRLSGAIGATLEALIAAFCRLDKSLSCCWEKGWLVGAVGIEPTDLLGQAGIPPFPNPGVSSLSISSFCGVEWQLHGSDFPLADIWGVGNVKLRLGRLSEAEFILVETSTLIPVCSSTRSLEFRPFRSSYERRSSLTKPPRLPLVVSTNGASAWFG